MKYNSTIMTSGSDLLIRSLRELEENVKQFSEDLLTVRMDDFKRAVIGEVNEALREHGEELTQNTSNGMESFAFCISREQCRQKVENAVEEALRVYQLKDADAALEVVRDFQDALRDSSADCISRDCNEYLIKVMTEVESALSMAKRIRYRLEKLVDTPLPKESEPDDYTLRLMAALSNFHRMTILIFLIDGEKVFSEIVDYTGLKAGHLQFHLNGLMDVGLVEKGKNRGQYRITAEGFSAFQALQDFARRLSAVRGDE
ncbi:MAG: hypothetical protein PWQ88_802 [Candidatus Methanomethylophilaceae archaeon]|nr:hypothetical protein [Candidatus Methanomethylophilaceae archaeon]